MDLEVLLQEAVLLCLSRSWGGFYYLQFYCLLDNTLLLFGQNLYLIVCILFCFVGYSACDYTSLNPDGVFRALESLLKPTFCSIPVTPLLRSIYAVSWCYFQLAHFRRLLQQLSAVMDLEALGFHALL